MYTEKITEHTCSPREGRLLDERQAPKAVFRCPENYHEDFAASIWQRMNATEKKEKSRVKQLKTPLLMRLKPITYLAAMFVGFMLLGVFVKTMTPETGSQFSEVKWDKQLESLQEDMFQQSMDYFKSVDMYDAYLEDQAAETMLASYFLDTDAKSQ